MVGSSGSPLAEDGLRPSLTALLLAQVSLLDQAVLEQTLKLQQAETLMSEAVQGFGGALQSLDVLATEQYRLAMELQDVLEVRLNGEEGAHSVEDFTMRILGTMDQFVDAMMDIGKSSFQLVEEMDGIRVRSDAMGQSLGELAEVAMQTHMLALNASIEAAHARKHGAGFAVVAGEVQKLSHKSARISDHIAGQVRETAAALNRTSVQVERIASKDLNEIIRSKDLAEQMVNAIGQSEIKAQRLVTRMEEVGREVSAQVARSIQALQFEDMVRQILQRVAAGFQRLALLAASLQSLAAAVDEGQRPLPELLAEAAGEIAGFGRETHDSVQAASMDSGDVELF